MISRREFSFSVGRSMVVFGATSILGLSSLHSFAKDMANATPQESDIETLVQYAFFILPILEPTHPRYRAVADKISFRANHEPQIASLMREGIAALNATIKDGWLNLPIPERVEIIRGLYGTPFFNFLHWVTAETVMQEPALWESLGYQGSSIEYGGYLHRGFDDIDWLPELTQEL